jgi:hypothetical protein
LQNHPPSVDQVQPPTPLRVQPFDLLAALIRNGSS